MDCRRPLAAFVLILLTAATGPSVPLVQARWTAAAGQFAALTSDPAECLAWPQSAQDREAILIGRVAFRTPVLLGGQAARAGLTCNSCHLNGRGNPDFMFPGLSDGAGTADVTSSLMSSKRGDGVLNPKLIPDLAARSPKISRDPANPALPSFIRGLIIDEFDGPEPSAKVLAGLTAYVRALQPSACPTKAREAQSLNRHMGDAKAAAQAALMALRDGDPVTARLMLAGARATLGLVHERYTGLPTDQALIASTGQELGAVQLGIDRHDPDADAQLTAWLTRHPFALQIIARHEPRSLYNPKYLSKALSVSAPPPR